MTLFKLSLQKVSTISKFIPYLSFLLFGAQAKAMQMEPFALACMALGQHCAAQSWNQSVTNKFDQEQALKGEFRSLNFNFTTNANLVPEEFNVTFNYKHKPKVFLEREIEDGIVQTLSRGDVVLKTQRIERKNFIENLQFKAHPLYELAKNNPNWTHIVYSKRSYILPKIESSDFPIELAVSKKWIEYTNENTSFKGSVNRSDELGTKSWIVSTQKQFSFLWKMDTSLQIKESDAVDRYKSIFFRGYNPDRVEEISLHQTSELFIKDVRSIVQYTNLPNRQGMILSNENIVLLDLKSKHLSRAKKMLINNLPERLIINDIKKESAYFIQQSREFFKGI